MLEKVEIEGGEIMPWAKDMETVRNIGMERTYYVTVPGFSKYEVSNQGSIRRVSDKMLISKVWTANGRCRVTLTSDEGIRKTIYFDHIMAKTFLYVDDDDDFEVHHIDGNKANFAIYNLKLYSRGKRRKGVEILETGRVYGSVEDCARAIGGTKYGIYACLEGRRNTYRGYHFRKI